MKSKCTNERGKSVQLILEATDNYVYMMKTLKYIYKYINLKIRELQKIFINIYEIMKIHIVNKGRLKQIDQYF